MSEETVALDWSKWDEMKTKLLPTSLEEDSRKPTTADQKAAWKLCIELRTRISTQELHFRSGDDETALTSLYNLFGIVRELTKEGGAECKLFADIAIHLLNIHIRPVTARWHKKLLDGHLSNDDERRSFRKELNEVQTKVKDFYELFAYMASGDSNPPIESPLPAASTGNTFRNRIVFEQKGCTKKMPTDVFDAEHIEILKRRSAFKPHGNDKKLENLVGLACSGGGIRSATVSLGVVQQIQKRKLFKDIDYLSTVSGGGYFGSFLSAHLNRPNDSSVPDYAEQALFSEIDGVDSPAIRKLRDHSNYLLIGGMLSRMRMLALWLYGLLVNSLCLLAVLLGTVFLFRIGEKAGIFNKDLSGFYETITLTLLALLFFTYPFIRAWRETRPPWNKVFEWTSVFALALTLGLMIFYVVQSSILNILNSGDKRVVFFVFSLPIVLGAAAFLTGLSKPGGRILLMAAGWSGPLLLLFGFQLLYSEFANGSFLDLKMLMVFLFLVVLVLWLSVVNINDISPHRYYRNRLAECYIHHHENNERCPVPKLSDLRTENKAAPYHLINVALNLPTAGKSGLRGRDAEFFTFSQDYCGSEKTGYCETSKMEKIDPSLDLATATATSGAAVSNFMGELKFNALSFWLTLLNVRLGYVLPNPGRFVDKPERKSKPNPYSVLWREFRGNFDETSKFINLSDGGHLENLGVYELLRRRCKFIIAIDAEADKEHGFGSLMKLIRFAKIDFGIDIEINLSDLVIRDKGFTNAHFSIGKISYDDNNVGFLLYVKSSLTGNEPSYVLDYKKENSSFPHESTADQFFSESQFEAYRALGDHIGKDLFHAEFVGTDELNSIEDLMERIFENTFESPYEGSI
ncbi:MAG: hypothetical protein AAF431_16935 [Pseudomonadota bacterium]